jgi:hypothetical protein
MKKLFLSIAALAFIATSMTSCKKDYSCDCTYDDGTGTMVTEKTPIKDAKKKDAEEACDALGLLYTLGGGKCELN